MDLKTLENLISNRGMVKITDRHGWGAGRVGIALGYRPLYHSVKVGFVDENGNYTGEYTVVPMSAVERTDHGRLTLEEALAEAFPEPKATGRIRVKIVYIDGVTEEVSNIPTEEIAAGIYAEACGNSRVLSAELIRKDGSHAAAYRFDDCTLERKTTEHIPDDVTKRQPGVYRSGLDSGR